MGECYILEGKEVVKADLMTWAKWLQDAGDKRIVKQEDVSGKHVSTVFLGLDHSFGGESPMLFETIVFPSKDNLDEEICERCSTWEQAEEQHKRIVGEVANGSQEET